MVVAAAIREEIEIPEGVEVIINNNEQKETPAKDKKKQSKTKPAAKHSLIPVKTSD